MTKKNTSAKKKLLPAIGMLAISGAMLASSTYAWFTMNKSVSVEGMKLKAQAEKGILINEMQAKDAGTWSEVAYAGQDTAIALRPASTANFSAWWHANSKITSGEAGVNADGNGVDTNTVAISNGVYYSDISSITPQTTAASADTNAARTVYYIDGTGTTANAYDDGEGYYIKYVYYIKSSSNEALVVPASQLTATVSATLQGNGAAQDLDKALRVGIQVGSDTKRTIFAPVANSTTDAYKVAGSTAGATFVEVTPYAAGAAQAINAADVTLPKVTDPGLEVDVYVWFEGEDVNCKSDNLAETLNAYQIDITFTDAALGTDTPANNNQQGGGGN